MHLLIPAAGVGRRMGSQRNKLLLTLRGQPLIGWTLMAAAAAQIRWIGIVGQPEDWSDFQEIATALGMIERLDFIPGGATRQESVYRGLQALPAEAKQVLIHDGARCLATPALFDRCAEALSTCSGLIAAIPVKDTIKVVSRVANSNLHQIEKTLDRSQLWAAQTPQGFEVEKLLHCHSQAEQQGLAVTDDAALFEYFGLPVQIVEGEDTNLKVTTPGDLAIAEFILQHRCQ